MADTIEDIFHLRRTIARIGETDWMKWWECYALGPTGDSIVPRLFRRTPELSAAHISFLAARTEHKRRLPKQYLVHLFDLGEDFEGGFERWLIERKAEGWMPGKVLPEPGESPEEDARAAIEAASEPTVFDRSSEGDTIVLGEVSQSDLDESGTRLELARQLVAAYGSSQPGQLRTPFFRLLE